ncbi:hypothetical protein BBP40_011966 [Aspergillus hancockii]|nr:hypothetical protein BBP40_011966 [Aspergillus hancockii]
MVRFEKLITLPGVDFPLETITALVDFYKQDEYYIYERENTWYLGLHAQASLVIDPSGQTATKIDKEGRRESTSISGLPTYHVRQFLSEYSSHGRIFGQVGFNYSARCSGQSFKPGQWPMLSIMVPGVQVSIDCTQIKITGYVEENTRDVSNRIKTILESNCASYTKLLSAQIAIDLSVNADDYKDRVARAIADIEKGKYKKAIPSRKVPLPFRVDMPATLLHGRRSNTPARTFSFHHMGMQATGFSPEVLISIEGANAFTEALAGTQVSKSTGASLDPFDNRLLNDAKEVMEHVIAIKGSIRRLSQVCLPETIAIKDFMQVMPRGSVQHLFSHVCGRLRPDRDGWDALPGLIANITVPGIPKQGNLEAMQCFEPEPRDLYCGAVLMLDESSKLFDATLILRTVFQDVDRQWLQAGAGVTVYSNPEREFTETCEKLGSVAPFVVPQADST